MKTLYHCSVEKIGAFKIVSRSAVYFTTALKSEFIFKNSEKIVHRDILLERYSDREETRLLHEGLCYGEWVHRVVFAGKTITAEKLLKMVYKKGIIDHKSYTSGVRRLRHSSFWECRLESFLNEQASLLCYDAVLYKDKTEGSEHLSVAVVNIDSITF